MQVVTLLSSVTLTYHNTVREPKLVLNVFSRLSRVNCAPEIEGPGVVFSFTGPAPARTPVFPWPGQASVKYERGETGFFSGNEQGEGRGGDDRQNTGFPPGWRQENKNPPHPLPVTNTSSNLKLNQQNLVKYNRVNGQK